jgi:hypothetical protein
VLEKAAFKAIWCNVPPQFACALKYAWLFNISHARSAFSFRLDANSMVGGHRALLRCNMLSFHHARSNRKWDATEDGVT